MAGVAAGDVASWLTVDRVRAAFRPSLRDAATIDESLEPSFIWVSAPLTIFQRLDTAFQRGRPRY